MITWEKLSGLLVCGFLGFSLLQAEALAAAAEPVYQGRSLSSYLAIFEQLEFNPLSSTSSVLPHEHPSSPEWLEARNAIRQMGTNAIPFLVKAVDDETNDVGAVAAFQILGSRARSAIPELTSMATDKTNMMRAQGAMFALTAIGPDGLPTLLMVLKANIKLSNNTEHVLFNQSMACIKALETNAAPAIPVLLQCAQNSNDWVAAQAMRALPVVGAGSTDVFSFLIETAKGPSASLRFEAVDALVVFRERAIPTWVQAFNDPDDSVRYRSYLALAGIAPWALTNATVVSVVAKSFQSGDPERREWGAQVLRSIGQQAHGEKPDCSAPIFDKNFYPDATNVLRQLRPELFDDKVPSK